MPSACLHRLPRLHQVKQARKAGVRASSLHNGKIFTPLQRHLTQGEMISADWLDEGGAPTDPIFKTPEQGTATAVWAATSPQLDGLGGLDCEDCDVSGFAESGEGSTAGVRDYAIDPDQARRLVTCGRAAYA